MVLTTYCTVAIIVCLIGYIMLFMYRDAETIIANSRNIRQDDFSNVVERGDIITTDGVVIASSKTDDDGNTNREYQYGNMYAHVVGYDKYGRAGLELSANFYMLRSHVNIFERVFKSLQDEKNRGDNVITTIDSRIQSAAYEALGDCRGAVVAIEPDTGKIRAMVSKPDYDPNEIDALWEYINTDEGSESTVLLNRATSGAYPPGSTFKIVTLLEFLRENENAFNNYSHECSGSGIYENVEIDCFDNTVHGTESLFDATANSCNTAFADIGSTFNLEQFRNSADSLLFNSELPFDGAYSKSYFEIDNESLRSELPQTVIGQGETKITPLHNALIMSAIANGGTLMKPYLLEKVVNDDGGTVRNFSSDEYGALITFDEAARLKEYLFSVTEYGTAAPYFADAPYSCYGKTGTAEYDDNGGCHSWFVGCLENEDQPRLVVSVIVEDYNINGLSGTYVARQVFNACYEAIE